jgi:transcriptional regulator with XRE-family HTH domain
LEPLSTVIYLKGGDEMKNVQEIREVIKKKGLKHKFLAEELGITNVAFSMFMNQRMNLRKSKLHRLYGLLDIEY